jgi:hypothetical protein
VKELPKGAMEHLLELGAVNSSLWALTDVLRPYLGLKDPNLRALADAGELGMQIMRLNDRRAELVESINKLTGEHRGNEKG